MSKPATKIFLIILGILIIAASALLPPFGGLDWKSQVALGILITAVIWWISEALPIVIGTWVLAACIPLMGIMAPIETWSAGVSPAIILYISAFAFALFFAHSSWSTRVAALVCRVCGGSSKKLVFGFMLATAIISAFVDNLPLVAVMLPIAYKVLDADNVPWGGQSQLAKTLVLGIIIAAYIGGWITPVGCIMNVIVQGYLAMNFGITVTFIQWIVLGGITAIIALPVCWFALVLVLKPEPIEKGVTDTLVKEADGLGKVSVQDIVGLVVILGAMVLWLLGSWVPIFDTATIGLLTLLIFFLPKLNILNFNDFMKESPWSAFMLVFGCGCIVAGVASTNAMTWIVDTVLMPLAGLPGFVILLALASLNCVIHNIMPSGPAVAGLVSIPFITFISNVGGISLVAVGFLCAVWSASAFLLPLDAPMYLGYSSERKYFSMADTLKSGIIPSIAVICIVALVIPPVCGLIGMA